MIKKIIRVYQEDEENIYFTYFLEEEWIPLITALFIDGGIELPKELLEVDLNNLSEKDCQAFFEAMGFIFYSFDNIKEENLGFLQTTLRKKGTDTCKN